jgi:NADH-quinone oxidoreductase subunit J
MMELWLTYGFGTVAVVLAISFVLIKHPVHAALSFACVVLAAAGVYLLQDAAFVAASTVVVYAGATIIIFMFVLMFAQQTNLLDYDTHKQNPIAAGLVAIALAASVIAVVLKEFPKLETQLESKSKVAEVATSESVEEAKANENEASAHMALHASDAATTEKMEVNSAEAVPVAVERFTVAKLGAAFYTRYLLAIEIAGTLLLVATIGAVVIAQREPQSDAKEATK